MKAFTFSAALAFVAPSVAYPGMKNVIKDIESHAALEDRQNSGQIGGLIGDLDNVIRTPVGEAVAAILQGIGNPQDPTTPPGTIPILCLPLIDPCCVWHKISAELTTLFRGPSGRCNDNARAAVRLGFHDAATWQTGQTFGGADGSLLMNFGEENRAQNNGLQNIRLLLRGIAANHGVGYADLAQYAHNHATVICPLGPRIRTWIGRPDATQANPDGLLPAPTSSAPSLIALFNAKTFSAADLAALVGAHTSSRQRFFDLANANEPQDSTPGVWDVAFYNETVQPTADPRLFRLPSDIALAADPNSGPAFQSFIGAQGAWNAAYSAAYVRMSLLGVPNINSLTECTHTLPLPTLFFNFQEGEFIFEK